jgi:hypothetical protein
MVVGVKLQRPVVYHHEVVAGALVFMKADSHTAKVAFVS